MIEHSLNKSVFRLLAGVSLMPLLAVAAQADDAQASGSQTLPPMVVTATNPPTPEDEVASSVTVITADDIARKQAATIPDILQDVPGLNVVQTGGTGGTTAIFIRGTNANHTKVFIDGIDASDPTEADGSFDFAHITTSDIERIEVLRGPQSGLYGSDAIGGVINIITKSGKGPLQLKASTEGGSFDTFNQSGSASGSSGPVDYSFGLSHVHSGATPVTPTDLIPPGRAFNPDSYDNKTLSTKLGYALSDNADLGFVARYIDTDLRFTEDDFTGPDTSRSESTTNELFTRATGHLALFDGRFDQTVGLGYTLYHHNDFAFDSGTTTSHGDRLKFDYQGNITVVPGEVVTLGAESQRATAVQTPTDAATTTNAGFVQLQSNIDQRLFNTLSLRFDDNDQFGSKLTYRVAPAWRVNDWGTTLKGSVGTGFKAPSLDQLFVNFPAFGFFANPNLKPEESLGYDLGVDQSLLGGRLTGGATWFHNKIKNLITFNDTFTTDININQAKTYGAETYIAWKATDKVKLRLDYTYTMALDATLDQELLRRPKHKATLEGSWQATDKLQLTSTLLYVGDWIDDNRSGSVLGLTGRGYTLVNVGGSYDLGHGVTAFGRIDNLLDKHYEDPVGFQRPGLGISAGLKIAFDTGLGGSGTPGQGATKKAE